MPTTLHTFVDLHARALTAAAHLLDKGAAFAASNAIPERDMLAWRLIEDMYPLAFQVAVVINFARQWPARVAGLPVPADVSTDLDVAGLKAAVAQGLSEHAAFTPAQFEGRDETPITFLIGPGMKPTLPAARWLTVFSTTNLHFHLTTAYAILRARGVPLGKRDLFAAGL